LETGPRKQSARWYGHAEDDKHGDRLSLRDTIYIPGGSLNVVSLGRLMEKDFSVRSIDEKTVVVEKDGVASL